MLLLRVSLCPYMHLCALHIYVVARICAFVLCMCTFSGVCWACKRVKFAWDEAQEK